MIISPLIPGTFPSREGKSAMTSLAGEESPTAGSARPFDGDGYVGYDPRLPSQRFGYEADPPPEFNAPSYGSAEDVFGSQAAAADSPPPAPMYAGSGGFSPERGGEGFQGGFGEPDGPILPPPANMQPEEGFALREWRRQNAIRLEEKEKREKELLVQIIEEAEQYKIEFYQKSSISVENSKSSNREREKLFVANQQKFHAEAEKDYWKSIADLIPREVPTIEKRGKKEKEKKPSIMVMQGPKPGKPTDLSRMRQLLIKLKHSTPPHMKPIPPEATESKKDAKAGALAAGAAPTAQAPSNATAAAARKVSSTA
ncbi:clathrin light chain 2-like [Rhodamnia argentea]|uniref:Clathrin light chain n=1 Tax=Rhodamnia argentea TaxID=178133 RepID=A0A8B8PSL7_9MYRT|nr:clathrin light chain 2-like [Rhodamnia argentea]XP_048127145.1 clathrin light chain 2-like [Rhodamnia argentea]